MAFLVSMIKFLINLSVGLVQLYWKPSSKS